MTNGSAPSSTIAHARVFDTERTQDIAHLLPDVLAVVELDARAQIDLDAAAGALFERDMQIGTNVAAGAPGFATLQLTSFCCCRHIPSPLPTPSLLEDGVGHLRGRSRAHARSTSRRPRCASCHTSALCLLRPPLRWRSRIVVGLFALAERGRASSPPKESSRSGFTIGGSSSAYFGRRAMRRLENRDLVADVAGGCESQAADQSSEGVADDVAEQIAGDDDAVVLGILGQPHGLRVDVGGPQRQCRCIASALLSQPLPSCPEVSRSTLGFSQMVTDLYPNLRAWRKAASQMRRAAGG